MKLNATVKIAVVSIYDEMQDVIVRTRSYTIITVTLMNCKKH